MVLVEDSRDGGRRVHFEVDRELARFVFDKGSITIDGVSLTVVDPRGGHFHVAVVPITLERTTIGDYAAGRAVNVEADLVGKWVARLMAPR